MILLLLLSTLGQVYFGQNPFCTSANAGVFNLTQFVPNEKSAVGLEPEVTLTDGAGFGANFKYTQGFTDINDLQVIIGSGTGPRRFRVGGAVTFDFFPDTAGQPAIGIITEGLYYSLPGTGRFELTAAPYIAKSFGTEESEVHPFFAFPLGIAFSNGAYHGISTAAVGAMFKEGDHLRYTIELGMNVNNAYSYFSGGITYYP